ncbi:hypothetical protein [Variovorax arabinosiphilus]|uniref:hypothetical protein n=1 Tax=Variovorax arabinosiphilus TaxID=3053498 RepID=UPI0025756365|nr:MULTISPECIES: hypothetical protein [unclassified Variovorax]MDM0120691.1 hypothetical protein [Variovorax sp. J2L1-78]MDM0127397.1 hypothetical protein [Variovorax sp. J2L1-63]MDM0231096.1 hypothetical protein [Variovorax sp. J2R1-6]
MGHLELRDLALSVRELPDRSFGWVILEGTGEQSVFANYTVMQSAEQGYASYADALLAGFVALRGLTGRNGPRGVGRLHHDP